MKYTVKQTSPGVFRLSEIVQDSQSRTGFDGAAEQMEFSPLAKVTRIRARKRIGDYTLEQIRQSHDLPAISEIFPSFKGGLMEGSVFAFSGYLFKVNPGYISSPDDDPTANENYTLLS